MLVWPAWIGICAALAILLRRRPSWLALIGMAIWCFVPALAGDVWIRPPAASLNPHPATYLVLIAAIVVALRTNSPLLRAMQRSMEVTVLLITVLAVVCWLTLAIPSGPEPLVKLADRFFGPFALFYLIGAGLIDRPAEIRLLRTGFLTLAVIQGLLGVVEFYLQEPLLYTGRYFQQVWFNSVAGRWMGTLDHPLQLSLLTACAIPLLARLRHPWIGPLVLPALLAGPLLSQSRGGLALAASGVIYLLLARTGMVARVGYFLIGAAGIWTAISSGLAQGVLNRFSNDTGSTSARIDAYRYFAAHVSDYLWFGKGIDASYLVASDAALPGSFENSWIAMGIDLGLVIASFYYLALVICAIRFGPKPDYAINLACGLAIVTTLTFTGLVATGSVGFTVWFLAGCSMFEPMRRIQRRAPGSRMYRLPEAPRAGSPLHDLVSAKPHEPHGT